MLFVLVQPVSIYVPRKNKHVFHDDVYNGVRSGEVSQFKQQKNFFFRNEI